MKDFYKTLLFDADGTLLDFNRSEHESLSDVLAVFGIPDTEENHRIYSAANAEQWKLLEKQLVTKSELRINRFRNFLERIGFTASPAEMADVYMRALASKSYLLDGALEVCSTLAVNHNLYIITNGFRTIQHGRFDSTPLAPLFRDVFISEDIGAEKPSPVFFDYVKCHVPGIDTAKTLVIGDSLSSDIAGGIAAGFDVCWFNPSGNEAPPELKIDYTIDKLSDILRITER